MKLLDKIPFRTSLILAIFLGLAPFRPEPHVWQKFNMLLSGDLVEMRDILDFLFHIVPSLILLAKIYRHKNKADQGES